MNKTNHRYQTVDVNDPLQASSVRFETIGRIDRTGQIIIH